MPQRTVVRGQTGSVGREAGATPLRRNQLRAARARRLLLVLSEHPTPELSTRIREGFENRRMMSVFEKFCLAAERN